MELTVVPPADLHNCRCVLVLVCLCWDVVLFGAVSLAVFVTRWVVIHLKLASIVFVFTSPVTVPLHVPGWWKESVGMYSFLVVVLMCVLIILSHFVSL